MNFYREVTKQDMLRAEEHFDNSMPESILSLVREKRKVDTVVIVEYKTLSHLDLKTCRDNAMRYLTFLEALDAYRRGKTIYTDY